MTSHRHVFRDNGYDSGSDFRDALLRSPAFVASSLKGLVPRGHKSVGKPGLANVVAELVEDGLIEPAEVIGALAFQSCRYLAMRTMDVKDFPSVEDLSCVELGTPEKLLDSFGENGWHGPFERINSDGETEWAYLHTMRVLDVDKISPGSGQVPVKRWLRWTIAARLHKGAISFHWNGVTHAEEVNLGGVPKSDQFRFWEYVDAAIDKLAAHLGVTLTPVNLPKLLYEKLWQKFESSPKHKWEHLEINAEKDGVALNAASSAKLELDGLRALTKVVAKEVVGASQWDLTPEQEKFEKVILHTLVKKWGTKSYGFQLTTEKGVLVIHARFYLGSHVPMTKGPKPQFSVAHILCYGGDAGGSASAANFLLEHL